MVEDQDPGAGQKSHTCQRAKVFGSFVAVRMIAIRWQRGDADNEISNERGDKVQKRVGRFGKETKASGKGSDQKLQ